LHPALQPFLYGILYSKINQQTSRGMIHLYPTDYSILCFDRNKKHFADTLSGNSYNYASCFLGLTDFCRTYSDCTNEVFQIIFKPFGVFAIFGIPQYDLSNRIVDGEDVFPGIEKIKSLMEYDAPYDRCMQEMEKWLLENLHHRRNYLIDPIIHACRKVYESKGNISVKNLCWEVCMSERNLRNYFDEQIGISPKKLNRLVRFNLINHFIDTHKYIDWKELTFQFGFFDQNHFIKEFKWFYGTTPSMQQKLDAMNLSSHITQYFAD